MSTSGDLKVFRIAAQQEGVFTRSQAEAVGLTHRMIRSRLERGLFARVVRDVLTLPGWPDSDRRRLFVATLAVRRSAVSRRSAAAVHGIAAVDPPRVPTVTLLKGTWRDLPGVEVHETRLLKAPDVEMIDLLPVTTPARTLVDLAAELRPARWAYVVDRALVVGRPSLEELLACYTSLTRRGRKGAAHATRYLRDRTEPPVHELSELEWLFEQMCVRNGLKVPIRQFRPPWYDGVRGIVDYGVPELRRIIELDGRSFHGIMQAYREDRRRDRLARRHGWEPYRYTFGEVRWREEEVVEELRPFLGLALRDRIGS